MDSNPRLNLEVTTTCMSLKEVTLMDMEFTGIVSQALIIGRLQSKMLV
jgi:hypothetical protein